jgi:calcineurin-like phosphoesterase family protein
VHVIAVVSIIRTNPVETVKLLLNSVNEVLASDDCIWNLSDLPTWIRVDVNV